MDRTVGTLVIADGGIAGLLACAAAAADNRTRKSDKADVSVAIWAPALDTQSRPLRMPAVTAQAQIYGLCMDSDYDRYLAPGVPHESDTAAINRVLLSAAALAHSLGAPTVLWPASAGPAAGDSPDLDRVAETIDRALLVSRLACLGVPNPVEIRVPYADITDAGLADLVLDMDLPIWTCWWAQPTGNQHGNAASAEREYWTGLLRAKGWSGDWAGLLEPKPATSIHPASRGDTVHQRGSA